VAKPIASRYEAFNCSLFDMKTKGPFRRPAASPYRRPDFYWRGGDVLREQEYVNDEYRKALIDYRRADQELKRVRNTLQSASQTLSERTGYTQALAGYLDGDTQGLSEETELRAELSELEREVTEHQVELSRRQAYGNPGVSAGLAKEKAYFLIEIERTVKGMENADDEMRHKKEELAAVAICQKYITGLQLEYDVFQATEKKKFLRQLVNRTKAEFDAIKPPPPDISNETKTERFALQGSLDAKMASLKLKENVENTPQKHNNYVNFLIQQIEELNARLTDLGLESETVDTEDLRTRLLNSEKGAEGPSDGNE
jgi:hypothetical protein